MKKDVLIDIKGMYHTSEGRESIELTTVGSFTRMGEKYYITYRETEATGMEGTVTTVKVEGNQRVTLLRSGAQKSRMVLERGQRHLCAYDTGVGVMTIGIFAENIQSSLQEDGGKLSFKYTLDINSDLASCNEVDITVREVGKQSCPMS